MLLIAGMTGIYYWMYVETPEKRFDPKYRFSSLMKAFKPQHWYYSFVMLGRRIMIALFVNFSYTVEHAEYFNLALIGISGCFLGMHLKTSPYKHERINTVEAVCLLLFLIVLAAVNMSQFTDSKVCVCVIEKK